MTSLGYNSFSVKLLAKKITGTPDPLTLFVTMWHALLTAFAAVRKMRAAVKVAKRRKNKIIHAGWLWRPWSGLRHVRPGPPLNSSSSSSTPLSSSSSSSSWIIWVTWRQLVSCIVAVCCCGRVFHCRHAAAAFSIPLPASRLPAFPLAMGILNAFKLKDDIIN